jgi:hypothetical protein
MWLVAHETREISIRYLNAKERMSLNTGFLLSSHMKYKVIEINIYSLEFT